MINPEMLLKLIGSSSSPNALSNNLKVACFLMHINKQDLRFFDDEDANRINQAVDQFMKKCYISNDRKD